MSRVIKYQLSCRCIGFKPNMEVQSSRSTWDFNLFGTTNVTALRDFDYVRLFTVITTAGTTSLWEKCKCNQDMTHTNQLLSAFCGREMLNARATCDGAQIALSKQTLLLFSSELRSAAPANPRTHSDCAVRN